MAFQTTGIRSLKTTIDFALLPSNRSLVAELQAGDEHDLAAKLNSFRRTAAVIDYRHAFAYLWARVSDLKCTTKLVVQRIRELRDTLPATCTGDLRDRADLWATYFNHSPADAPTLVASIHDLRRYGLDAHRYVAVRAVVHGIQLFYRLSEDKDAMLAFAVELAAAVECGEWDVLNGKGDYILGFQG